MQVSIDDKQAMQRAETARCLLSQQAHRPVLASESDVTTFMARQFPRTPDPQISKAKAFEIIARVRKRIAVEKIRANSLKDYEKKAFYLLSTMDAGEQPCEGKRWTQALDGYAGQANSFRANKAAACWYLRQKLNDLLSQQDVHQRAQRFDMQWHRCVDLIAGLEEVYEAVYNYTRQIPKAIQGLSLPTGKSKSRDLKVIAKKHPNWMELMRVGAASTKYVGAQRVLELIGCRPEELEQGISVTQTGPATATFTLTGAKVTKFAGQPWRKISLPISNLDDEWIGQLRDHTSFIVKIDSKDGLRKCLQRVSQRVLPGVPFATGYVYRHAFATMLRDRGYTTEEIGELMGHSVAETQRMYGFRKGGGRKVNPAKASGYSAEVPREVRPLKKGGLKSVLAKKKVSELKVR